MIAGFTRSTLETYCRENKDDLIEGSSPLLYSIKKGGERRERDVNNLKKKEKEKALYETLNNLFFSFFCVLSSSLTKREKTHDVALIDDL